MSSNVQGESQSVATTSRKMAAALSLLAICAVSIPARLVHNAATSTSKSHTKRRQLGAIRSLDQEWRPSHMRVCQIIMDHFDDEEPKTDSRWGDLTFVVDEDEMTCNAEIAPMKALEQMFASAYMARQGQEHGIPVDYVPNCERFAERNKVMNVQQSLPSPLLVPDQVDSMDRQVLYNTCLNVLELKVDENGHSPTHTVLYGTFELGGTSAIIDHMIDFIRPNLRAAVLKWRASTSTDDESVTGGVVNLAKWLFSMDSDSLATHSLKPAASLTKEDTAVVSLHCHDWKCHDMLAVPFWAYALAVPRSARTIDILLPEQCTQSLPLCLPHAESLRGFLADLNPRSEVNIIATKPTSMDHVGRLIESENVLCGLGWSSLDCHFPALARDDLEGMTILQGEDDNSSPLTGIPSTRFGASSESSSLHRIETPHFASLRLNGDAENPQQFTNFLRMAPYQQDCRHIRGREGHWIINEDIVPQLQYQTPLVDVHGNQDRQMKESIEKGEVPAGTVLPSSRYSWAEGTGFGVYDDAVIGDGNGACEYDLLTLEGLCTTLFKGGFGRIFFLGDSLQLEQVQSFWKVLGFNEGPDIGNVDNMAGPNFKHQVNCPNIPDFEFVLEFARNDELLENSLPVHMGTQDRNCNGYCFPWTGRYFADLSRTLLVVNTGAHLKSVDGFKEGFNRFLETMTEVSERRQQQGQTKEDVVLVRTTPPGHQGCNAENLVPHETYEEYKEKAATFADNGYGWENFEFFNDYIVKAIDMYNRNRGMERGGIIRNQEQGAPMGAKMEVLDVFPMTVLRQDGHEGGHDCLHYSLPGPVDWWNHLLFSNFNDLVIDELIRAKREEKASMEVADMANNGN